MKDSKEKSVWSRLLSIDRRILYWVLVILIIIPLLRPFGFPIPVLQTTEKFYDTIKALPAQSVVVLDNSARVIAWSEIGPATIAATRQLIAQDLRVIIWSTTTPDAPLLTQNYLLKYFDTAGKKYGQDYVLIGYVPGEAVTMATLAKDIHYPGKDFYGTDLGSIPMLANVNTAKDISLIVVSEAGNEGAYYVGQWGVPYGTPIIDICTGALVSERLIFYNAGTILGIVAGSRGGAELELLTKFYGVGVATADVLSMTHMYLLVLIVLGNIAFFSLRSQSRRENKK